VLINVPASMNRPWNGVGGFYTCDFFPPTPFEELSDRVEVRSVRDARGRWRSLRGVYEVQGEAVVGPAYAVRCREPGGHEGIVITGGELGVIMMGVGHPGEGSPILWIANPRDLPPSAQEVLSGHRPGGPNKLRPRAGRSSAD
jgi:hypothetical protein